MDNADVPPSPPTLSPSSATTHRGQAKHEQPVSVTVQYWIPSIPTSATATAPPPEQAPDDYAVVAGDDKGSIGDTHNNNNNNIRTDNISKSCNHDQKSNSNSNRQSSGMDMDVDTAIDPDLPTMTFSWKGEVYGPPVAGSDHDGSHVVTTVPAARIGLPIGTEPVKPTAGDFRYSGMHDQGPLPAPREGGPMAELIACIKEAKAKNDAYLTSIIEREKQGKQPPRERSE